MDELSLAVRQQVYEGFLSAGQARLAAEMAGSLGVSEADVRGALARLAEAHALVVQPASGEVLMANPFSAVPTAFSVRSRERSWWGNCIWDGLGILAMVDADGVVATACPDCGEALTLHVIGRRISGGPAIAHFAVPVRAWWDDVVFT